jgi:hypothetical protein
MARGRGRPFGPNNNANPSGRPKVNEEFRKRAREAVDAHVLHAWITEVETLGEHWVKCSELLAAYGYGRPAQEVQHSGADGQPLDLVVKFVGGQKT